MQTTDIVSPQNINFTLITVIDIDRNMNQEHRWRKRFLCPYSILNFYKKLLLTQKKMDWFGMKAVDWIGWTMLKWLVS